MSLVGKRLGKLVVIDEGLPPDDEPRRIKYRGTWYRVHCDCGNDRWLPKPGIINYKSCGCARLDHMNTKGPGFLIKHMPNKPVMGSIKEQVYTDL